jgi:hypothetical protein
MQAVAGYRRRSAMALGVMLLGAVFIVPSAVEQGGGGADRAGGGGDRAGGGGEPFHSGIRRFFIPRLPCLRLL